MLCTRASAVLLTQHDIEPATQCNIGSVPQESAVLCTQASAVPATQGTIEPATQASAVLCTQKDKICSEVPTGFTTGFSGHVVKVDENLRKRAAEWLERDDDEPFDRDGHGILVITCS